MDAEDVVRKYQHNVGYIIRSGLAGGIAGCVAKTLVAPLDRVKILFQTSSPEFQKYAGTWSGVWTAGRQIYSENGPRGLFQGHSVTLLRIFPYAATKFMAYDHLHHLLMPTREQETNLRRFTAGALSGMTSVCVTYPFDMLRVRIAFESNSTHTAVKGTLSRALHQIYSEHSASLVGHGASSARGIARFPLLKFYRGFTASLAGMVPYAGVSFLSWGFLHRFISESKNGHKAVNPFTDLGIGACSGALGQSVSYPFEVIRRRMQVGGITNPERWLRWDETVSAIWRAGGWRGFYVGLSIGYMKVIPMTAVSFTVWQKMKKLFGV